MRSGIIFIITFLLITILQPLNSFGDGKWYQGGTLHKANGLEWQKATYANKLATCGDFIGVYFKNGYLNDAIVSKINSIDDFKPLAIELANSLDDAFKRDPDDETNKMLFTNQEVASTAAMIVILGGWANIPKK